MIFECALNSWSPRIGDPHFMGWVTVVIYFITSIHLFHALRIQLYRGTIKSFSVDHTLWISLIILSVLLGINKQFDIQTLLTQIAKCTALAHGWYENRRSIQILFIAILGLGIVTAMATCIVMNLNTFKRHLFIFLGTAFLMLFVFVRATSFHHMDSILYLSFINLKLNWILELIGPLLINYGAWIAHREGTKVRLFGS